MELDHLKTFDDAARTLSFSEIAQRLHTTQPTVSKHIKELESELGVDLFERVIGGRLKLSQVGQSLLPWAQQLLRECNKFHEIAHSLNEHVTGTLTIVCATASGKYLLPLLAALGSIIGSQLMKTKISSAQLKKMIAKPSTANWRRLSITRKRARCATRSCPIS